jgi:hypothetical protein
MKPEKNIGQQPYIYLSEKIVNISQAKSATFKGAKNEIGRIIRQTL